VIVPGVEALASCVSSAAFLGAVNWHTVFFLLFAALACGFAVAVVAADNVVRMALIWCSRWGPPPACSSSAGAEFIGAMQLMIYVGGTLVLLVFGVMLTAQTPFVSMASAATDRILAAVVAAALLAVLLQAALSVDAWKRPAAGRSSRRRPRRSAWRSWACGWMSRRLVCRRLPFAAVICCPSKSCRCICSSSSWVRPIWPAAKRRKTPRPIEVAASVEPPASVAAACDGGTHRLGAGRRTVMNGFVIHAAGVVPLFGGLLTSPVSVAALPRRRCDPVCGGRGLHGDEAQRPGRAHGHRTGAQRR